jgi:hypothetical protein
MPRAFIFGLALLSWITIPFTPACAQSPTSQNGHVTSGIITPDLPITAPAMIVVPGTTTTVPITPSVYPLAFGYDVNKSKLFLFGNNAPGTSFLFGYVDESTGIFTQIPLSSTPSELIGGIEFTIVPSNAVTNTDGHAFIPRNDGLLDVDLRTGAVSIDTSPAPSSPNAIGYDPQSQILYAPTSTNLVSITPSTGVEYTLAAYPHSLQQLAVVSAVDPYNGFFFVEEQSGTIASIDTINETSGNVSKATLSVPVIALGFDISSGRGTSALYGITECCNNVLVQINPSTGAESQIAVVGNSNQYFPGSWVSGLDGNDGFFTTTSLTSLVTVDTAANRSWYIDSPMGEADDTLNQWMGSAGQALGGRDAALPAGQTANSILDFGLPHFSGGAYGASRGANRFLAVTSIEGAVVAFADGWYAGLGGNTTSSLQIIVGIDNKGGVTQQHGQAWAAMVGNIAAIVASRPYAGRVKVVGGMDMELGYSGPTPVASWVRGYGTGERADYGDAQGCPDNCIGGWTAAQVINLGGSMFFPEIYGAGGGNAGQWAGLSQFSQKTYGHSLNIVAPLSELTACVQREPTCNTPLGRIDNTPTTAWIQMVGALARKTIPGGISSATNIEYRIPR